MTKIFLSYRRDDTAAATGRIYDRLRDRFGGDDIFRDVGSIPLGSDFREHVKSIIAACSVELVVIGKQWLTITNAAGQRRLDLPNDPVRMEIEVGLSHGIPVVPLTVDRAPMPTEEELPPSIRALATRNGLEIDNGRHFDDDVRDLVSELDALIKNKTAASAIKTVSPSNQKGGPRIFLVHSHRNNNFAKRLASDLQAAGADVWLDLSNLSLGEDFVTALTAELYSREWLVPILTPDALRSQWVRNEINAALQLVRTGQMKGVIPIIAERLNPADLPIQWQVMYMLDATENYDSALRRMVQAIASD